MSSYDFGEDFASAATRLAQDDDYLVHFGVKGMKWGIRRYQNEDGTLTPAGKERYRSTFDGGTSKAAEEFYRKAVAKSSNENDVDLMSSLPVQHAVARLRNDSVKMFEVEKDILTKREDLIKTGYDDLSDNEKQLYDKMAVDEAVNAFSRWFNYSDKDRDAIVKDAQDHVRGENDGFGRKDMLIPASEEIMADARSGWFLSGYGQYYAKNSKQIESKLSDLKNQYDKMSDDVIKNMRNYISEFTKGFGQYELKDLSQKYGEPYTVNDKLSNIVSNLYMDYGRELAMAKAFGSEKLYNEYVKEDAKRYEKWRKEAFKKNPGNTKLY